MIETIHAVPQQTQASAQGQEFLMRVVNLPLDLSTHVPMSALDQPVELHLATLAGLARSWGRFDSSQQGWGVANVPSKDLNRPESWLTCGVERLDEAEQFADDTQVDRLLMRRAGEGSLPHQIALEIHVLCNVLRHKVWGPQYVGSRTGPDR